MPRSLLGLNGLDAALMTARYPFGAQAPPEIAMTARVELHPGALESEYPAAA